MEGEMVRGQSHGGKDGIRMLRNFLRKVFGEAGMKRKGTGQEGTALSCMGTGLLSWRLFGACRDAG